MTDSSGAVDPSVTKAKFEREVEKVRAAEEFFWKRGCWIRSIECPTVRAVFLATRLKPATVVFGAVIDFTDYDLLPPSVQIVDPLTFQPYAFKDLPTPFPRKIPVPQEPGAPVPFQPLAQAHDPNDRPFLCIPGVREYHAHPAHSGDSWLLRRGTAEGTLYFILDQLCRYGVENVISLNIGLQFRIAGFQFEPVS